MDGQLKRNQVHEASIPLTVDALLNPEAPLALRLSGQLLLGVVRIYARKMSYLQQDCQDALIKIRLAFKPLGGSGALLLPAKQGQGGAAAALDAITLPDALEEAEHLLRMGAGFELTATVEPLCPLDPLALRRGSLGGFLMPGAAANRGGFGVDITNTLNAAGQQAAKDGSRRRRSSMGARRQSLAGAPSPSHSQSQSLFCVVHMSQQQHTSTAGGEYGMPGEDELFDVDAEAAMPFDLDDVEVERLRDAEAPSALLARNRAADIIAGFGDGGDDPLLGGAAAALGGAGTPTAAAARALAGKFDRMAGGQRLRPLPMASMGDSQGAVGGAVSGGGDVSSGRASRGDAFGGMLEPEGLGPASRRPSPFDRRASSQAAGSGIMSPGGFGAGGMLDMLPGDDVNMELGQLTFDFPPEDDAAGMDVDGLDVALGATADGADATAGLDAAGMDVDADGAVGGTQSSAGLLQPLGGGGAEAVAAAASRRASSVLSAGSGAAVAVATLSAGAVAAAVPDGLVMHSPHGSVGGEAGMNYSPELGAAPPHDGSGSPMSSSRGRAPAAAAPSPAGGRASSGGGGAAAAAAASPAAAGAEAHAPAAAAAAAAGAGAGPAPAGQQQQPGGGGQPLGLPPRHPGTRAAAAAPNRAVRARAANAAAGGLPHTVKRKVPVDATDEQGRDGTILRANEVRALLSNRQPLMTLRGMDARRQRKRARLLLQGSLPGAGAGAGAAGMMMDGAFGAVPGAAELCRDGGAAAEGVAGWAGQLQQHGSGQDAMRAALMRPAVQGELCVELRALYAGALGQLPQQTALDVATLGPMAAAALVANATQAQAQSQGEQQGQLPERRHTRQAAAAEAAVTAAGSAAPGTPAASHRSQQQQQQQLSGGRSAGASPTSARPGAAAAAAGGGNGEAMAEQDYHHQNQHHATDELADYAHVNDVEGMDGMAFDGMDGFGGAMGDFAAAGGEGAMALGGATPRPTLQAGPAHSGLTGGSQRQRLSLAGAGAADAADPYAVEHAQGGGSVPPSPHACSMHGSQLLGQQQPSCSAAGGGSVLAGSQGQGQRAAVNARAAGSQRSLGAAMPGDDEDGGMGAQSQPAMSGQRLSQRPSQRTASGALPGGGGMPLDVASSQRMSQGMYGGGTPWQAAGGDEYGSGGFTPADGGSGSLSQPGSGMSQGQGVLTQRARHVLQELTGMAMSQLPEGTQPFLPSQPPLASQQSQQLLQPEAASQMVQTQMCMSQLTQGRSRLEAARWFFEVLSLKSTGMVQLSQGASGDVGVALTLAGAEAGASQVAREEEGEAPSL